MCRCTATLVLAALVCASQAAAMGTCEGTYAATLLQPLPEHITAGIDIHNRSPRNLDLGERFLAGVHDAGVAVGAMPNLLLHVTTSRLDATSTGSGRGEERSFSEMSGLQGGPHVGLPPNPGTRLTTPRAPVAPPLLIIRVDATVGETTRIAWVASVQCSRTGTDDAQLARDLGRVIGGALGQRIERRPL